MEIMTALGYVIVLCGTVMFLFSAAVGFVTAFRWIQRGYEAECADSRAMRMDRALKGELP